MSVYLPDVQKYAAAADAKVVENIVKYCGIALSSVDGSLVSATDKDELARVRDGFAARKLGLDPATADAGIAKVIERMKNERRKSRVTFYYLLAEVTSTLTKLA
jgi:hypothetical protein